MAGWFTRYLIVSAVCIAAVWFGTPVIKANFAGKSIGEITGIIKSRIAGQIQPASPETSLAAVPATPVQAPAPAVSPTRTLASAASGRKTPVQPVVTNYITKVEYEYEQPDGTMGSKPPEYQGSGYPWGVFEVSAPVYTSTGDVVSKMPGGTVVEKMSEHKSNKGTMYRCRILRDGNWREGLFVESASLVMFGGSYDATRHADRDLIVKYFTLKGKVADHRLELKERAVKANPHFTEYQRAAQALTEFQDRTKKLVAERDSATGMARHKVDDELRMMKGKEASLINEFRRVETPYKKWRQEHAGETASDDDAIRGWQAEMDRIESDVEDVAGIAL